MASRVKGITLEIGGNVTGLDKALKDINSRISGTQKALKDVERLLKLDPGNTELLAQKQKLLRDAVNETKEKLEQLKEADKVAKKQLEEGNLGQDKYDALQREIIETEQKLESLKQQGKNSGDGLQKAMQDVNTRMKDTQENLKEVDRLLKLDPGNAELLAQKQRLLRDAVSETKEKLEQLKEADRIAKEQLESGDLGQDDYDALQREIVETEEKLKSLQEETKKFGSVTAQELQVAGQKFSDVGDKITDVGGKMTKGVTVPLAGVGAAVVKTAEDFEAQMSKVSAISGATGDDLQKLRDKAREMGEKTKFSATEAGEAYEYMAMAGWKTEDMLNGIDGIMNLAAASGTDLATTSDIVTDALTGFGLSAEDAGHFADIMAAASSNANTNVEMMGETFKYVAPVAGAMGYRAEDVSVAIGLMANSGIKATQAGTSLRTLLTNMAKPTEQMATAMETLGVSLDDGHGNMKSFKAIMDDLRAGFGELKIPQEEATAALEELEIQLADGTITQEEYDKAMAELTERCFGAEGAMKAEAAAALAGKEGMSGLLAIVNASEEDYLKLSEAIANCSYNLDDITKAMEDSDIQWAKYAEKAWMTTGDGIQGLTEEILYNLNEVGTSAQDLQDYLTTEYEMDPSDALDAIQTVQKAMEESTGVTQQMADTMQDNLAGQITILKSQLQELALSLAETLMPIVKDVVSALQKLVDWFNNLSPATQELIVKIGLIAAAVGPVLIIVGTVISSIGKIIGGIGSLIGAFSGISGAVAGAGGLIPMLGGLVSAAAPFLIGGAIIAGVVAGVYLIIKHWDDIKAAATKVKDDVAESWDNMKESISATASGIKEKVSELWNDAKEKTSETWTNVKETVTNAYNVIKDVPVIGPAIQGMKETMELHLDFMKNVFTSNWGAAWGDVKQIVGNTVEDVKTSFGILKDGTEQKFSEIRDTISEKWNNVKDRTAEAWDNIKSRVSESWQNMKDSASSGGGNILSTVSDKFGAVYNKIAEKMNAAQDKVHEVIERIKGLFDFHWKLPELKLPHIFVGEYIDVPVLGTIPNPATLSVKWYKKAMDDPRILKGASIFGYSNGKLLGGGEAGEEVVSGKDTLLNLIRQAVESVQSVQIANYRAAMQEALQSANVQVTYGDIHMNVYGAEGQDVNELADIVSDRIKGTYEREKAVWK